MHDVAKAAGVHPTTVSMALRAHPSIPPATATRIRAVAKRLRYMRDPQLDAFNNHRVRQRGTQSQCVAFIVDANMSALFGGMAYHPRVYEGVRAVAEAHHHTVEVFQLGTRNLSGARLNSILSSRGMTGVLLSTFNVSTTTGLDLDWDRYCAVKIETHHLLPQFDVVSSDQFQAARLCLRKLRELGYRRIGMTTARDDEARLNEHYSTGVLVEQADLPECECVPPLLFQRTNVPEIAAQVTAWIREHRVDVVMTNWNELIHCAEGDAGAVTLTSTNVRIPQDVAWASLDVPPGKPQVAGVVQNHRLVGMRAMEQLAVLVKTYHRGAPVARSATYVPGFWHDSSTAPRKQRLH